MHAASFLTTAQKRYNTNLPRGRGGNKKGEDRDRRHSRTIERGRGRQTKKGTYRERNKSGTRRRQGARRTVGEKSVTIAVFAISSHPVIRVRCAVHCVSGFLPEKRTYLSHRDCTIETERSAARIPKLQLISTILPDKFVQRSHIRSAGTLIPRYRNLFLGDRNKEGYITCSLHTEAKFHQTNDALSMHSVSCPVNKKQKRMYSINLPDYYRYSNSTYRNRRLKQSSIKYFSTDTTFYAR